MRKGENIFKRRDGRWEARYIKSRDLSGRIRYGFCYGKTYKEAKEKAAKCKALLLEGKPVTQRSSRRRFSDDCDEWLRLRKNQVRESTYIKYDTILERHIKPDLGSCFPESITTELVNDFTEKLITEDGLSAKTVHDILVVLRGILRHASVRFPGWYPAVEITYPKESRKEMRVLSREEQDALVRYLLTDPDPCKFGTLLMLLSGIRIGELCALRWRDINLKEKTIRIGATLQRLHDSESRSDFHTRIVIGAPKSDTSARLIPLTDSAIRLCARFAVPDGDSYVLTGKAHYMEPRALQYRLRKYTADCGLEGVHAHTLRHTFATRAVEAGFEIKSLSEVLGHSSTTITLDRYVHSSLELKRANMEKLSGMGL